MTQREANMLREKYPNHVPREVASQYLGVSPRQLSKLIAEGREPFASIGANIGTNQKYIRIYTERGEHNMDIRYSANQRDVKRYTTEELRDEFLITGLYKADEVVSVYSHVDRMVTLGCMPVNETVSIDKGMDVWANFGTTYFLERREIGIFNIGDGAGTIVADGVAYHMNYKDCLYITQGTKEVTFASDD